jgi:hypothetical protein
MLERGYTLSSLTGLRVRRATKAGARDQVF